MNYDNQTRFSSVPHLPSKLKRNGTYSSTATSRVATEPLSPILLHPLPASPIYQSMTVRFDTPDPYIIPWRRQIKVRLSSSVLLSMSSLIISVGYETPYSSTPNKDVRLANSQLGHISPSTAVYGEMNTLDNFLLCRINIYYAIYFRDGL